MVYLVSPRNIVRSLHPDAGSWGSIFIRPPRRFVHLGCCSRHGPSPHPRPLKIVPIRAFVARFAPPCELLSSPSISRQIDLVALGVARVLRRHVRRQRRRPLLLARRLRSLDTRHRAAADGLESDGVRLVGRLILSDVGASLAGLPPFADVSRPEWSTDGNADTDERQGPLDLGPDDDGHRDVANALDGEDSDDSCNGGAAEKKESAWGYTLDETEHSQHTQAHTACNDKLLPAREIELPDEDPRQDGEVEVDENRSSCEREPGQLQLSRPRAPQRGTYQPS
jgi:hypothetical protein